MIYCASIRNWPALTGADLLPPERRARLHRYRQRDDQLRCLIAGLLLRYALGQQHTCLQYGPQGKPSLAAGPCFNLSHAGDYVVLGVSNKPIGVDIEHIAPWDPRIAERVFTPEERAWLAEQPGDAAFYRLWTAKESIMKLTGLGFAMPPESFSCLDTPYALIWHELPGHILCVAQEDAAPSEAPVLLSRESLLR